MARSSSEGKKVLSTGIVKDTRYMDHWMGDYHPECPQRLEVIYAMLEEPDMKGLFIDIPARKAKKEELALIHSSEYIDLIASSDGKESVYLDGDIYQSNQHLMGNLQDSNLFQDLSRNQN